MAIPAHISKKHIIQIINQIDKGRSIERKRLERKVALRYNGNNYPVKILISWANELVTGQEFPSKLFVTQEATRYLSELGFEIITINKK
jgi:hypothetical protein